MKITIRSVLIYKENIMYDAEVGKRLNSNNRQMFRQPIITSQDYALFFFKKRFTL